VTPPATSLSRNAVAGKPKAGCFTTAAAAACQRHQVIAQANAGGVVQRVGDRRQHAADAEFADSLGLHRRCIRIGVLEKEHFLSRNVGKHRRFIACQVVVDEEAETAIHRQLLQLLPHSIRLSSSRS
jgi:hypothetical protein